MLASRLSGGTPSRNLAASRSHIRSVPLYLLGLFVIGGAMLGVLDATSASAGRSVFPGRNGGLLLAMKCKAGGGGNSGSCGYRYAMMNADGSSLRVLRPSRWYGARWSRDGQRILAATGQLSALPAGISVLKPAGGPVTTIWGRQRGLRTDLSVGDPDWLSPKRIVFLGWKASRTGIYTMALDGTRLRKLREYRGLRVYGLRASPDGRRIAFTYHAVRAIPTDELYVMNADGSGLRLLRNRCFLKTMDWSPDGKRLLVVSAATREGPVPECVVDPDLEVMSVKNGAVTHLLTEKMVITGPGQGYGGRLIDATFSPDGTRIAFLVDRQPNGSRTTNTVMVMNSNGTGLRQVHQGETRIGRDNNGEAICIRCVGYESLAWQPLRRYRVSGGLRSVTSTRSR